MSRLGNADTTSDEHITCFRFSLFPLAIAALKARVEPEESEVRRVVRATEHLDDTTAGPKSRRRRCSAPTGGLRTNSRHPLQRERPRCLHAALCHVWSRIEPRAGRAHLSRLRPRSDDRSSNGITLCANHHIAFDRHQLTVLPKNLRIVFRPDILVAADFDPVARAFVDSTLFYATHAHPRHRAMLRDAQHAPQSLRR